MLFFGFLFFLFSFFFFLLFGFGFGFGFVFVFFRVLVFSFSFSVSLCFLSPPSVGGSRDILVAGNSHVTCVCLSRAKILFLFSGGGRCFAFFEKPQFFFLDIHVVQIWGYSLPSARQSMAVSVLSAAPLPEQRSACFGLPACCLPAAAFD